MRIASSSTRYGGRLAIYVVAGSAGSALGSMLTWTSDTWADANPLIAAVPAALLSIGPAAAIAAVARVGARVVATVAGIAALGMIMMWSLFVTNEGSTSSLVFLWGLFAGIPLATLFVLGAGRATASETARPMQARNEHTRRERT